MSGCERQLLLLSFGKYNSSVVSTLLRDSFWTVRQELLLHTNLKLPFFQISR